MHVLAGLAELESPPSFETSREKIRAAIVVVDRRQGRLRKGPTRSTDNRVTRLRRKLAAHGVAEDVIETVRGGGYVCRR